MRKILAISRYTLLDAARSRLIWLVLVTLSIFSAASFLIRELAITDSLRLQTAFLATSLRAASGFLIAAFIISTLQREFNDKGPALLLALDLPRGHYVLGKTLGLLGVANLIALACALPLALLAAPGDWAAWSVSLLFEAWIIAAISVFCGISLRSVAAGLSLTLGFYLLAKSLATLQLISHASLAAASISHRYMTHMLDTLALFLPRLDEFAQTRWLVDGISHASMLGPLALQALIFSALVTAAAIFDMYRKNL